MPQIEHDGQIRVFDRVPFAHPRQREFALSRLLRGAISQKAMSPAAERAMARGWRYYANRFEPFLDQGQEGACVGFAWAQWLNAGPVICKPPLTEAEAREIYLAAQRRDEWPGEGYEGSSVNGGGVALRDAGAIVSFWWGWAVETLENTLLALDTPVVVGSDFYWGMMDPDQDGFLHATGGIAGGHAYLVVGVNRRLRKFKIKNSWGRGWGKNGYAWISYDDMAKLLGNQGEMCIAKEVCLPKEKRPLRAW